jgi:heme A synthase
VTLGAQVRGGVDAAIGDGTPRAQALAGVGAFDTWHREGALVVLVSTLAVIGLVWNRHSHERALVRIASVVVVLASIQILLGVSMAYVSLTPAAQVAHLTGSSLLLGAETVLFLLARWLPAR